MASLFRLPRLGDPITAATSILIPLPGDRFEVTGTGTIATLETNDRGPGSRFYLSFADAVTLTHNEGLALRAATNYTTAPGDTLAFEVTGENQVRQLVLANNATSSGGSGGSGNAVLFGLNGIASNRRLGVRAGSDGDIADLPDVSDVDDWQSALAAAYPGKTFIATAALRNTPPVGHVTVTASAVLESTPQAVEGEVRRLEATDTIHYNGVTITPGDSLSAIQTAIRASGTEGDDTVLVSGESVAAGMEYAHDPGAYAFTFSGDFGGPEEDPALLNGITDDSDSYSHPLGPIQWNSYFGVILPEPQEVGVVALQLNGTTDTGPVTFRVQSSNDTTDGDNGTWTDRFTLPMVYSGASTLVQFDLCSFQNPITAKAFRVRVDDLSIGAKPTVLEIYAYQPNREWLTDGTGTTIFSTQGEAPYFLASGAFANGEWRTNPDDTELTGQWIGYEYAGGATKVVDKIRMARNNATPGSGTYWDFEFQGWDGSDWVTIQSFDDQDIPIWFAAGYPGGEFTILDIEDTSTAYTKHRVFFPGAHPNLQYSAFTGPLEVTESLDLRLRYPASTGTLPEADCDDATLTIEHTGGTAATGMTVTEM